MDRDRFFNLDVLERIGELGVLLNRLFFFRNVVGLFNQDESWRLILICGGLNNTGLSILVPVLRFLRRSSRPLAIRKRLFTLDLLLRASNGSTSVLTLSIVPHITIAQIGMV